MFNIQFKQLIRLFVTIYREWIALTQYICEQLEKTDDIEFSNAASANNGSDDVCNNVPVMQQVDWSYLVMLIWNFLLIRISNLEIR